MQHEQKNDISNSAIKKESIKDISKKSNLLENVPDFLKPITYYLFLRNNKKREIIEFGDIYIENNSIYCQDDAFQISNISRIWIKELEKASFPLWSLIFLAITVMSFAFAFIDSLNSTVNALYSLYSGHIVYSYVYNTKHEYIPNLNAGLSSFLVFWGVISLIAFIGILILWWLVIRSKIWGVQIEMCSGFTKIFPSKDINGLREFHESIRNSFLIQKESVTINMDKQKIQIKGNNIIDSNVVAGKANAVNSSLKTESSIDWNKLVKECENLKKNNDGSMIKFANETIEAVKEKKSGTLKETLEKWLPCIGEFIEKSYYILEVAKILNVNWNK